MRERIAGAALAAAIACAPAPDAPDEDTAGDAAWPGRWDISVLGADRYPLWLELTRENGAVAGRLQPRGGHALPIEDVHAEGAAITFRVGETTYEATLESDRLRGTGVRDRAEFDWVGVRAPELPAAANPEWGSPVELFDGESLAGWEPQDPEDPNNWRAEDGVLVNTGSGANLRTEDTFHDFRLHIEVNVPEGGNSGIYLRGRHEIQVQDDARCPHCQGETTGPHSRHMGGIYGQITPTENAALSAGEWQTFDVTLLGRWVTVTLNGTTIIDHQEIPGITGGALDANEAEPGPILLQGDHGPVSYRNIVLTPRRP